MTSSFQTKETVTMSELRDQLFHEILMARRRVYEAGKPTPLDKINVIEAAEVFIKREDLTPIHAYKWRGAYNTMRLLDEASLNRGVVCSSAGNHAQGVALAAKKLGTFATIYMPRSTPRTKRKAVERIGGDHVEVKLKGDFYNDAADAAHHDAETTGKIFIHPYDDLRTMGGQGTMADEIVMSGQGPFDIAFVQIGGGGMAAAVACWLKAYFPDIYIIGVEGEQQASMAAAVAAGEPVTLDHIDVFADGTAVRRAGDLTYPLCEELIDEFITVSNEELCAAIETIWQQLRVIPEPSGAMGLAGLMQEPERIINKRALTILCGANLDFGQLAWISRHAGIGAHQRHYVRFTIGEEHGTLLGLLEELLPDMNIIEFQYGKTDHKKAWPVIGFEATPAQMQQFEADCETRGIPAEPINRDSDVEFRLIHYRAELFSLPLFVVYRFPERPGALRDFLRSASPLANICYFNYLNSGERVGRAMLGFEFEDNVHREKFIDMLKQNGHDYEEVDAASLERML